MEYSVDIVIPVWNRPVEVRSCLASLACSSPNARIIMVNCCSERETERILDEFAELLDDRAMLVSTQRNVGRVAAINHGLSLASAPLVLLVHDGVVAFPGWLEPMVDAMGTNPDIGLLIPAKNGKGKSTHGMRRALLETDHGSLGVMMVRRELYASIGGFDADMDGDLWCLRDYSRRAERAGFRTARTESCRLDYAEPQQLGSLQRQEERLRRGAQLYLERWGEQRSYCFLFLGEGAADGADDLLRSVMTAARQGSRILILADKKNAVKLVCHESSLLHDGIVIETLPPIFTARAARRRLEMLRASSHDMVMVDLSGSGDTGGASPHEFIAATESRRQRHYFPGEGG